MSRSTSIPLNSGSERRERRILAISRRSLLRTTAVVFARPLGLALFQANAATAQDSSAAISTTDLGGATLLQGAGCNVIALAGPDGALMIDGGRKANADTLVAAVLRATGAARINTLINTHWHPDQTGANETVGGAGGLIVAQEKTAMYLANTVYASVAFTGRQPPLPEVARPKRTVRGDGSLEFAGQTVEYGYLPAAHTDGDLFVHLPKLNLMAVGGVASAEGWPLLDYRNGAWLGGRVRALERLASLVRPDTRVVPADGRLMTGSEIISQRDIYQKLFVTMIGYLNMGLGPKDAVERRPLKPYEAQVGDASAFVDGALRSMQIAYVPD
jgi:cyclase